MSIKKKIILSFFVSFSVIFILSMSAYVDFLKIRKEVGYLELADSIRSKSLQLRRHEKNFLLGDFKEENDVRNYLSQLRNLIGQDNSYRRSDPTLQRLNENLIEYSNTFERINKTAFEFQDVIKDLKSLKFPHPFILPFIESTFLDYPIQNAELLKKINFASKYTNKAIEILYSLSLEISSLRRLGEEILVISKDLDRSARERVENIITISRRTAFILIPTSFLVGFILLFVISQRVVDRLRILVETVEKTGKGYFSPLPVPSQNDEVSTLIETFNKMEEDLKLRENELIRKEEELLQSRKLAALGTLASGVAHELNNPLNNIYLATQTLSREILKERYPEIIMDSINDIHSQTLRVKRIISDLLEFTRGKQPEFTEVNLREMIDRVYNRLLSSLNLSRIKFFLEGEEVIFADQEQMEQVFINLLSNAVEAMSGEGMLRVKIFREGKTAKINVSDSGMGIANEIAERIFEPFFSTKEKGTGLGLSIVYSIIKKHNGEISVDSTEGKGTTFTIDLPTDLPTKK
jgi:signal transduction histidine kinase